MSVPFEIADGPVTETITVLRAHSRRLAKLICADGTIEDFNKPKTFDLFEAATPNIDALEQLLRRLERRPDCCVVRGAVIDPLRVKAVRRLLHPDKDEAPTLREVPRRWLAFDFDLPSRPDWLNPADLFSCGRLAVETLPQEFRRARFIVQATAGHGLKPGARIRLWCWLNRVVSGPQLKYWLRRAPVDPSVFGAAHIIYTAAPVIEPGAFDPLTSRLTAVPGDNEVIVPAPERLQPPKPTTPKREHPPDRDDISGLIHTVETAGGRSNNRNNALYWAARRCAERGLCDNDTADRLEEAAIRAGLSQNEAAATVRSGLRHG